MILIPTTVNTPSDTVLLVTIYSKTEQTDISADELRRTLDDLLADE